MTEASSTPAPLDRIDRRILALLQRDGRLSNAELARKVNLSPASCHRRTRRL
ncbi:MAG: AsnC family transcriptional regulator, partial [Geminicoccaceae bacterium]